MILRVGNERLISVFYHQVWFYAAPSIEDALCHDRRATSVHLLAPGNYIGPDCIKFGSYIPYMVEI